MLLPEKHKVENKDSLNAVKEKDKTTKKRENINSMLHNH